MDSDSFWLDTANFYANVRARFALNKPETDARAYRHLSQEEKNLARARSAKGGKQTKQRGTNVGRG
jgi:hypothetical protein